jgi:Pectate lyase superfamily protein
MQKNTENDNRRRPGRRALLTGGAVTLAAVAGATLGGAKTANAQVASGQTAWIDVQDYGADPTGAASSVTAFTEALAAVASAGGGVLYIPVGQYLIESTLSWTSADSLMIIGDGEDATVINRASATAPFHTFDIRNSQGVTVQNLNIVNTVSATNFTDDQVGLYFASCDWVRLQNVRISASANRVNIAVELSDVTTASIIGCDLRGYVNALNISDGTVVVDCLASAFYTNSGSGVTNSGNIAMIAPAGTVHLTNCETNGGDHGLILNGTGSDAFVFINDLEINNTVGDAVVLDTGSQFWANQLWCSNQGVANTSGAYNGITVGSGFTGWMVIDNSTFQHYSGTGITILGGKSYWITNSSFSGCCGYAADVYYDIYLSGCSDVIISSCHFDIEPFNSMNTPNAAVCVSSGVSNVIITSSQFATSGYHTGSLINDGTNVVNSANLGA